jgi:hypothetical protein
VRYRLDACLEKHFCAVVDLQSKSDRRVIKVLIRRLLAGGLLVLGVKTFSVQCSTVAVLERASRAEPLGNTEPRVKQ